MTKFKAKETLMESFKIVKKDLLQYILITIVAESFALLLIHQVGQRVFDLALLNARVDGITNENVFKVIANPITIALLLLSVILIALFIILQMTLIMGFANRSYNKETLSLKLLLKPFKRIKFTHFLILIIYVFLIMPNGNFGVSTSITSNLHLPAFIVDFIFENSWFTILYILGIVISFYLNLRFFYSFIIFTTTDSTFPESLKKSWDLTSKNIFSILKLIGLFTAISAAALVGTLILAQIPLLIAEEYYPSAVRITNSITQTFYLFVMILIYSYSTVVLIQMIVVSYHKLQGEEPLKEIEKVKVKKKHALANLGVFALFVCIVLVIYFDDPSNPLAGDVLIVAHRGESQKAVENSIESLELAKKNNPDFVEMDIQQTKDHEIVVFHDFNLKRLGGIKNNVNDYNLKELQTIPISSNGNTTTIPSFDEYLAVAKKIDQKLLIEIKTTGKDSPEFLEDIMELVKKHDMENMVMYQSLDKDAILNFKEMYPQTTVGYILGLNIGRLEKINVDFYALEDFSMRGRILEDAKRQNKGILVWTVNTEELMNIYLQMNVSGIITDYPEDAKRVQKELQNKKISDMFWNFKWD